MEELRIRMRGKASLLKISDAPKRWRVWANRDSFLDSDLLKLPPEIPSVLDVLWSIAQSIDEVQNLRLPAPLPP